MNQMMMGWGWGRFRDNSKNAYILVYERMVKEAIGVKECESRGEREMLGVKEGENEVDFEKLAMCEVSGKSSEVWRDNYEFMMDHHLYSEGFVGFMKELIGIGIKESAGEELGILVDFLMKFLFEVACFTNNCTAGVVS